MTATRFERSPGAAAPRVQAGRSVGAVGARCVVAATAPTAAAIGLGVVAEGGNAFDAALAAAFAETVLLPPKCGLAGDLVALVLRSGEHKPTALVAIGAAPEHLAAYVAANGLPFTGGVSVGVPGAPSGYAALADLARLPLARLVEPAVEMARGGFVWSALCARLATEADDLLRSHHPSGTVFRPKAGPLASGDIIRTPGVAGLLERFADAGAALWRGDDGGLLVERVQRDGGVLTERDLDQGCAEWAKAVALTVHGRTVWSTPLPTHGPSLLAAIDGALRGDDPATRLAESAHDSMSQRRADHGDPARARRDDGTSTIAAADRDGNAVVIVHSNSFPQFGSGLVVDELDVVLNNRVGRGFTDCPGHPNAPAAGRRPMTTLHAWALSNGEPGSLLLGATPGGESQMPWNAQTVVRALAGERSLDELVTAPLWEFYDGGRRVERAMDGSEPRVVLRGDRSVPAMSARSAQVIVSVGRDGPLAAADPRLGALAVGW